MPAAGFAADFNLPAPVTEAEIYLQGATLLRSGTVDLPAGTHRLLVPYSGGHGLPDIALSNGTLGAVEILPEAIADGRTFLTPAQQTAHEALLAAEEAAHEAEDARLRAAAAMKSAEDQLSFLRSLGGESLSELDAKAMEATLDLLATRVAPAEVARTDARAELRTAERAVEEAERDLAQARIDLRATGANLGPLSLLAVGVTMAEAGSVTLEIESFSDQAGWATKYDVSLGADDVVTLDRKVDVWQRTDLPLTDVAVTLSTADPFAQTAPNPVFPDQARLRQEEPERAREEADLGAASESVFRAPPRPAAMAEPVVAQANFDGPVVTYDYPEPVTLPAGGSVTLALDTQTLDARVFNRANPRVDQTAFLMAELTNSTGEPLLPGAATLYREGARIGESRLPLMPAGDEVELAFGPQEHLRLEFIRRLNSTGDRGLFFTSGTRQQDLLFRVRNLSTEPEVVETRFALPYSEEEDLEVAITTTPEPDARNVEDRRGVAQWDLEVAAGAEVEVEIGVTLEWPEGERLEWQP